MEAVRRAAAQLSDLIRDEARPPLILDVGSGGGWAARWLKPFKVIAIDLLPPTPLSTQSVRADMRRLPLCTESADGALFVASLHYAPVDDVIPEAARVLRPGGMMVAVASPIYPDKASQISARSRSAEYYARAGFPELVDRYHPIETGELRSALERSGFRILRFEGVSRIETLWRGLTRQAPNSLVAAQKISRP
ncbi:MAG TPA: methyltransferase domain-containing protein [Candidatus Dormibacteraeota bacterium]|nr:methyltransferase domain-containing protein [Candidatus Dormibacteraeota bacterium]